MYSEHDLTENIQKFTIAQKYYSEVIRRKSAVFVKYLQETVHLNQETAFFFSVPAELDNEAT